MGRRGARGCAARATRWPRMRVTQAVRTTDNPIAHLPTRLKMFIHDTQAGEHTSRRHVPREGRRRGQHHGWRYLVDPSHEEGATRSVAANRTMNAEGRTTSCAARSTAQGRRRDQHHVWRYLVEHVHVGRAARSSGNSVGTRGIDSKEGATRVIAQSAQGSLRRATGQPQGSHRP